MAYYKDFPNSLSSNAVTDKEAIRQSIRNIINTKKGSVPGKPDFGCPLDAYLFEQLDDTLKDLLIGDVNSALTKYEPRISVEDVSVEFQEAYNRIDITVNYTYSMVKTDDYESITISVDTQS